MSQYDQGSYRPSGFGGFSFFPPVIKNLLIINGAVFFLMMLMQNIIFRGVPAERVIIHYFALMPIESGNFQIWQLVTYQFLHGGFSHILFNMFALWMFGVEIENSWGSKKFLTFYLISGTGAGLLHMFLSPVLTGVGAPTIGASGSVYGIMIAFAMMFPERLVYIYFLIPVKAKYLITFLIVMEFMLVDSASSGVAHLAHLGGALVGFLFIMFDKNSDVTFKNLFKKKRPNPFEQQYYNSTSSNPSYKKTDNKIQDASFYDVIDDKDITQDEIDKILDKISKYGYAGLSDKEKKVLFEASKRMK
jgi:membrane associated rhomboid family serine protease